MCHRVLLRFCYSILFFFALKVSRFFPRISNSIIRTCAEKGSTYRDDDDDDDDNDDDDDDDDDE
ncbi:hypothetical protein ANN_09319 [Periplaneta americana]|uniref:Secreted protein n=1 Tax=Periplaneta americana TaxID=6978 RepID=A0ABQ8TPK7_PERAM|nr:hypothetical protein ANN_09319 [Periplaneta americana]